MDELIYASGNVPLEVRHLFSQLETEFSEHKLWVRRENFGRTISAAIVNQSRGVAVTIPIVQPTFQRRRAFEAMELGRIRAHLEVGSGDLALP